MTSSCSQIKHSLRCRRIISHRCCRNIKASLTLNMLHKLPTTLKKFSLGSFSIKQNPDKGRCESFLFLITRGNFLVGSQQYIHVFQAHKTCILRRRALNTPCWRITPQLVGMHGICRTVTPDSETNYSNSCHCNWQGKRVENKGEKHLRDS